MNGCVKRFSIKKDNTSWCIISVPPYWILEPENKRGTVGTSLDVMCKAGGVPSPTITWKKVKGKCCGNCQKSVFKINYTKIGNGKKINGKKYLSLLFKIIDG